MKNLFKNKVILSSLISILFFIGFLGLAVPSFTPANALNLKDAFKVDDGDKTATDPLDYAADQAGYNVKAEFNSNSVAGRIAQLINILLSFVGVVFLVLMIYGGFMWMIDRGNQDKVKKARELIQAAVIGLIIVVSAYAISYFVINVLWAIV
jgi:uncharacterized iron-regulated membrane protein